MGREKPPILLKDECNKIIDNNLAGDNFCKFFYSTYILKMMVKCHILINYMRTWRMILFLVVMILNPYYINSQIKALPDRMVYPIKKVV